MPTCPCQQIVKDILFRPFASVSYDMLHSKAVNIAKSDFQQASKISCLFFWLSVLKGL